ALGSGSGDAHRVHGDFGAARTEADHFDRIALRDLFGQLPLLFVGHSEGGALVEDLLHRFDDSGMAVPGHERSETEVVVHVFVAVEIVDAPGFALLHEDGVGLVVAIVAGYPERNALESPLISGGRTGGALLVSG